MTIVTSWNEMLSAILMGETSIKFADNGDKYIAEVNINSQIMNENSCEIDFNGWTIGTMNIYGFTADRCFNYAPVAVNLTINHLSMFNTLSPQMLVFYEIHRCYFDDVYYEAHETEYTDFAVKATANLFYKAFDSTVSMRSEDYSPRVPWYMQGFCYNCEIKLNYKWTKSGAGNRHMLIGGENPQTSSDYLVGTFWNCYIYGKIDLREGSGEWQFTTIKGLAMVGRIKLETCIVNIETLTGENSTFDNFGVVTSYPSGASTWADIPQKTLIVTNNGNSQSLYQSAIFQDGVYIGGVCANVVRTQKEDLKNRDWLVDIVFSFIPDDEYREPQYGSKGSSSDLWEWRKSNYVNNSVPFLPFWKYPVVEPPPYNGDVPENEYICIFDMQTQQGEFEGHGLAVLRPSSCRVVEELNGSYNLTLTHPRDAEGKWQYILEMNIIKCMGQLFVIQRVDEVLSGGSYYVTAYAEHISYTLNDRWIFPPVTIAGYRGSTLMASILEQSTDMGGDWQTNYTFTVSSDIDAPSDFRDWYEMPDGVTPYEMLLGSQGFIAKLGGELYRDNFEMRINQRMHGAQDNAFELAMGYNLTGIKRTVDLTTFCTYLRCYDVSDDNYGTWWAVSYDPSTLPRAYPRNVVRSKNFSYDEYREGQLERDGFAFWNQNCAPLVTYELNVKDLKHAPEYKYFVNNYRFKVGDKGRVWDERLSAWVEVEITRTEKDGITGETTKVVIGSQRSFTRPNSYNPITPVNIDADKIIEGMPPIRFMSDGGNLRHMTIYGAAGGVGDEISYGSGGEPQNVHYSLTDGQPDAQEGYYSSTDTIPVQAGYPYTLTTGITGTYQVLYYDGNGNYLSYSSNTGSSYTFVAASGAKSVRVQIQSANPVTFDVSGIGIPVTITQFDTENIIIPLANKLYEGDVLDISQTGLEIPTFSGENVIDVLTTVKPRIKIQYKEPVNTYERIVEDEVPITVNADGTPLLNWIIYGASGGVIGEADIFSGGVSAKMYNPSTGELIPSQTGYYSSDDLIEITENTAYRCVGIFASGETIGVGYQILFYDDNQAFYANSTGGGTSYSFTAPTGAKYARLQVGYMTSTTATGFHLYGPALSVTVSHGTNSQNIVLPVTEPLYEGDSISFEDTEISIPTYDGETTITVDSEVKPRMKIQYTERRG